MRTSFFDIAPSNTTNGVQEVVGNNNTLFSLRGSVQSSMVHNYLIFIIKSCV